MHRRHFSCKRSPWCLMGMRSCDIKGILSPLGAVGSPFFNPWASSNIFHSWSVAEDMQRHSVLTSTCNYANPKRFGLFGISVDAIHIMGRHIRQCFPKDWSFAWGNHRSPVDSSPKGSVMWNYGVDLLLAWASCCAKIKMPVMLRQIAALALGQSCELFWKIYE